MDHRMPGTDGEEAMKQIRRQDAKSGKHSIIIALTADNESGVREQLIEAGFDDYLSKPVDSVLLEDILLRYCPDKVSLISPDNDIAPDPGDFADPKSEALLKEIEDAGILDISAGISNCGGKDLFLNAVQIFADNGPDNEEAILSAASRQDITDATIRVHALKSNARILGMHEMSDLAASLEQCGNDEDSKGIFGGIPSLLEDYHEKYTTLSSILNAAAALSDSKCENAVPIDESDLNDALSAITECAGSLDFDSIEAIIEELSGYRLEADASACISAIKKAAANADSMAVCESIETYKKHTG
jgi:CheY-like chemotaxis protein